MNRIVEVLVVYHMQYIGTSGYSPVTDHRKVSDNKYTNKDIKQIQQKQGKAAKYARGNQYKHSFSISQ